MEVNLNIEKNDICFILEFLKGKFDPVELDDMTYQIAIFKTQEKRKNKVKIYNPNCEYKAGDLIFKEYHGKIPIGAKKCIEIEKGVVLRVVDVRTRFGMNEIKLSYEGTSDFRDYTNYLKKQKIELLLPHMQKKISEKFQYLSEKKDPRQRQDPLIERDFVTLKKKLITALKKEPDIAYISNKILLKENLKPIGPEIFNEIREFLIENKKSETTEFFVEKFIKIKPINKDFHSYCFALNYRMKMDYKIDFQQTKKIGWGKWNLISVIYYMKRNSLISEENPLLKKVTLSNKKNISQKRKKFEGNLFDEESTRYFLTQREVSAGALRLKQGIYNFGDSIEIDVIDANSKKSYLLYYYRDVNLVLGFKEIFESYKALQGTILTFEQIDEDKFQFNIRMTKKGTIADIIEYNTEMKIFNAKEEKIASPVFVNKSIFLETDVLNRINKNISEFWNICSLNKLVHKIFLEFGIKEKNYEIHILRLYNILNLIYPVELKLVEDIILCNSEFVPSEKNSGIIYLDSDAVIKIEDEEKKRREILIEKAIKKREEIRKKKINLELKQKEEIRKKREERRKKRELEMWEKERLLKERADKKIHEQKNKREELKKKTFEKPDGRAKLRERKFESEIKKDFRKKDERVYPKQKPDFLRGKEKFPLEEFPPPKVHHKKMKKKIEEEKPLKERRKIMKKTAIEKINIEEMKSEIQLEELKEKVKDEKETNRKREKPVAFKDEGGFGSVFADKLDEIIKKEDKKEKKKSSKK